MRCSHNAKFSLALSRRSFNTPWGLFHTREIFDVVLVYRHGFSGQDYSNMVGLLKEEQKQEEEALLSGRNVVIGTEVNEYKCSGDFNIKQHN